MIKDFIKKWWAGKIQINVTYVTEGVNPTFKPRVVEESGPIYRSTKSNVRFISKQQIEPDGREKTYYFSEVFQKGDWKYVSNSFSGDKNEAMRLHLQLINGNSLETQEIKTILWEGLSKDEAETWVELQKVPK